MRSRTVLALAFPLLIPAAIASSGCNAILGVEEGELDPTIGQGGSGHDASDDGASGGGGTGGTSGDCTTGDKKCDVDGLTPLACDEGEWKAQTKCAASCVQGACVDCVPQTKGCDEDAPRTCNAQGAWETGAPCAYVCAAGTCTGVCKPGTKACDPGNQKLPVTCNAGGQWESEAECATLCVNGACGTCKPDIDTQCKADGVTPQVCGADGNSWVDKNACQFVCLDGQCAGTCKPNDVRCSGASSNMPERCDGSGNWVAAGEACTTACVAGACTDCKPSSTKCIGIDQLVTCDANGVWPAVSQTCPFACVNDACGGVCKPGAKQCQQMSNILQECDDSGAWVTSETCPFVCANSACMGECIPNTMRCNGKTLESCSASATWQTKQTCANVCVNNKCVDCDYATFQPVCLSADKSRTCTPGNAFQDTTCTEPCLNGVCGGCTTGDRKCDGNVPSVCTNNTWVPEAACSGLASICKDGRCFCPSNGGPDMVPIGSGDFCIDVTEVTQSQYAAWLATIPPTEGQLTECAFNNGFDSLGSTCVSDTSICSGPTCIDHPIVCVDWCDAYAYCKAMGKRLCGSSNGGGTGYQDFATGDARSEWHMACSAAGANDYVYGDTYDTQTCNVPDASVGSTKAVGDLSQCTSPTVGYQGTFDLSGNVAEWVDSCGNKSGGGDDCHIGGGSYKSPGNKGLCAQAANANRANKLSDVGFRCCSRPVPPKMAWVKAFGGAGNESVVGVNAWAGGSSIVVGSFAGATQFGTLSLTTTGGHATEAFTVKLDPSGSPLWARQDGNHPVAPVKAMSGWSDGSVVLTGEFAGSASFGYGGTKVNYSASGHDAFAVKYDLNGNSTAVFATTSSTADERGLDVAGQSDGSFVVVGEMNGEANFGATTLTTVGANDAFVTRIGASGTPTWATSLGGNGVEAFSAVGVGNDASIVAAGFFTSPTLTPSGSSLLTLVGSQDMMLVKYTDAAGFVWAKQTQGGWVSPTDITFAADDSFVVSGVFSGTVVFGKGEGKETTLTGTGNYWQFLARYNANGTLRFARTTTSGAQPPGNLPMSVRFTPGGSLLVASGYSTPVTLGLGEWGETSLVNQGMFDALMGELAWDGTVKWMRSEGGVAHDVAAAAAPIDVNNSVVAGHFTGTVEFAPTEPNKTALEAVGGSDVYLMRLVP